MTVEAAVVFAMTSAAGGCLVGVFAREIGLWISARVQRRLFLAVMRKPHGPKRDRARTRFFAFRKLLRRVGLGDSPATTGRSTQTVLRSEAQDRAAQIRLRIAELEAANDATPKWGAAVGARCSELKYLRAQLAHYTNGSTERPSAAKED